MKWIEHTPCFSELRDDGDCLRGSVHASGGEAELEWFILNCSGNMTGETGTLSLRIGADEAKELLLAIVEDRPARLVLSSKEDPYAGLDFRAGDRFRDADGFVWLSDADGEVHPEDLKAFRWTVQGLRAAKAAERVWWPLRKI